VVLPPATTCKTQSASADNCVTALGN